ncbi:MAG: hypothetical protein GY796_25290 [Chloroflexi bacterium]|nr:hypothetical protein [Chloroflexota bacterium]
MPYLSRWMIRAAFIYLLLGFTIGGLMLANKGLSLLPAVWGWLPVHIEFLLMGWIVQLVMGVAFWILPRYWTKPRRPHENYVWIAFALLNLGIWLVTAATLLHTGREILLLGRVVEVGGALFFARHAWGRIVSRDGV